MSNKKDLQVANETKIDIQAALLNIVQRSDIDPDRLEKFMDLQIKLEERQAEKSFNEAMANFQRECPIINKTKKVDFSSKSGNRTKYDYAPLDEMIHVIKPILTKYGLSYAFDLERDGEENKLLTTIAHIDGHKKSFSYYFDKLHDDNRMNSSQRRKSALTFAKRSALENALGVVTQDADDDAQRAVDNIVTSEQVDEIYNLLRLTDTGQEKFMTAMKIDSIEEMDSALYKKAINMLRRKRAKTV